MTKTTALMNKKAAYVCLYNYVIVIVLSKMALLSTFAFSVAIILGNLFQLRATAGAPCGQPGTVLRTKHQAAASDSLHYTTVTDYTVGLQ